MASPSPLLKMLASSAVCSILLFCLLCEASAVVLLNSTDSSPPTNNFTDIEAALKAQLDSADIPKARRKRYISQNDMIAILDYHNQVRGKVFPPAANMEYMVRGIRSLWILREGAFCKLCVGLAEPKESLYVKGYGDFYRFELRKGSYVSGKLKYYSIIELKRSGI